MLHRSINIEVRGINREAHTVDATVNSLAVDSYGTILLPAGCDFERYAANPLFAWGHPLSDLCSSPGPERILGKAAKFGLSDDGTRIDVTFEYAVAINPTAKLAYELTAGGYLRAYSVGAVVHEWVDAKASSEKLAELAALPGGEQARTALLTGACKAVALRWSLVEISAVFVGANPDALVAAQIGAPMETINRTCARARSAIKRMETLTARLEAVLPALEDLAARSVPATLEANEPEEDVTHEVAELVAAMTDDPELRDLVLAAIA